MKTILRRNELDTKSTSFTNKFLIKNSLSLSNDKWYKGSRSRGLR